MFSKSSLTKKNIRNKVQVHHVASVKLDYIFQVRGRWMEKNRKKLTNVSLVCMYVGRKSEMSVFFCFFSNRSNLSTISMVA